MSGAKNPSGAPKFRRVDSFVDEFTGEKFVETNVEEVKMPTDVLCATPSTKP